MARQHRSPQPGEPRAPASPTIAERSPPQTRPDSEEEQQLGGEHWEEYAQQWAAQQPDPEEDNHDDQAETHLLQMAMAQFSAQRPRGPHLQRFVQRDALEGPSCSPGAEEATTDHEKFDVGQAKELQKRDEAAGQPAA